MATPFGIDERSSGDVRILSLSGSLDGHTFVELERHLDRLLGRGVTRIVLDLSDLKYIASAGVGIMVNCLRRLREADGTIVLFKPTAIVMQVIDVLGLASLFTIENEIDEAVAAAQS